jgi:hypothetical protein
MVIVPVGVRAPAIVISAVFIPPAGVVAASVVIGVWNRGPVHTDLRKKDVEGTSGQHARCQGKRRDTGNDEESFGEFHSGDGLRVSIRMEADGTKLDPDAWRINGVFTSCGAKGDAFAF